VPDVFSTGFRIEKDWQAVIPVGYALVGLLGLAIGVLVMRYRATRVPSIP